MLPLALSLSLCLSLCVCASVSACVCVCVYVWFWFMNLSASRPVTRRFHLAWGQRGCRELRPVKLSLTSQEHKPALSAPGPRRGQLAGPSHSF